MESHQLSIFDSAPVASTTPALTAVSSACAATLPACQTLGNGTQETQKVPAHDRGPLISLAGGAIVVRGTEFDRKGADAIIAPAKASAELMTLAGHQSLFSSIVNDQDPVAPEVVRDGFERLMRDMESVKGELKKLTVEQLLKRVGMYAHDKRKAALVDQVFRSMLTDYGYFQAETAVFITSEATFEGRVAAMRARLAGLTPEHLAAFRERTLAEQAKHRARMQALKKAVTNPETLEEFQQFIEFRGREKLSSEQQVRYEDLVADKLRERSKSETHVAAAVAHGPSASVTTGDAELIETRHTRDGYDLFVIKLIKRVDGDQFKQLCAEAKKLSGWYSKFRGEGAVPGFQFKTREDAQSFMSICLGTQSVGTAESAEPQPASREAEPVATRIIADPRPIQTAASTSTARTVEKLKTLAAKLKASAEASLNRPRLSNTSRRAQMASAAEAAASADLALANTIANIADAIASGQARHLEGVTDKVQVAMLNSMLDVAKHREIDATSNGFGEKQSRRGEAPTIATTGYVSYPEFKASQEQLRELAGALDDQAGFVQVAGKLKRLSAEGDDRSRDIVVPEELALKVLDKLTKGHRYHPWYWVDTSDRRKRLQRMGLECVEQLRAACREFLQYREGAQAADRVKQLERNLIGSKVGIDFFPTPRAVADEMVAFVAPVMDAEAEICEPSAGNGNIAEAIRAAGFEPEVVEISNSLREILAAKSFVLVGDDFLKVAKKYRAFVMNPPFGNGADIDHVRHAWSLLEEGGRISAIVGEGAFIRSDRKAVEFRDWLESIGAEVERLPNGTFNDRSLMASTSTNARRVSIEK